MAKLKYMLLALFVMCFMITSVGHAIEIQLKVKERSGHNRDNSPVTVGVPFSSQINLLTIKSLSIKGQDAQFRVLSRYNGPVSDTTKPIRMVLVDFQANVGANQTRSYTLTTDGSGTVSGGYLASWNNGEIIIDSGSLKAVISPEATSIINEAWVDNDADSVYDSSEKIIHKPVEDGLAVAYGSNLYYSGPARTISIEENGPLRSIVKLKGSFAGLVPPLGNNELSYTIRLYAYKNKSYFKTEVILENENRGWMNSSSDRIHNILIDSCYIKTTLNGLGAKTVRIGQDYTKTNYMTGTIGLLQQELSDGTTKSYNWKYEISETGNRVKTGTQFDSYTDVRNDQIGLMVASKWFWQNHPKQIRILGDELYFDLWPKLDQTYRIIGGSWKTHTLMMYFHPNDSSFDDELADLKKGLFAACSAEYYTQTNFFTSLAPGNFSSVYTFPAGEKLQAALDEHSNSHRAKYDSSYIQHSSFNTTIFSRRDSRMVPLDSATYATWYGINEFGAIPRGSGYGYSSQHYDWSYLSLMGFLRFGDYNMFDIGQELVSHKADLIVIHDSKAGPDELDYLYHGGQRYELDGLFTKYGDRATIYNIAPKKASHFWTKGMTLQYLLTGQERYREAVEMSYEHINRTKDSPNSTDIETRNQSRGIDALVNGYKLKGNIQYLDNAYSIFENHLLTKEGGTGDGRSGWIKSSSDGVWMNYDSIMVEPLVKLYLSLTDAGYTAKANTLFSFLTRWRDWIVNDLFPSWGSNSSGTYKNNKTEYFPYTAIVGWESDSKNWYNTAVTDSQYTLAYADLFALFYNVTKDVQWLNLARSIFKDYHMYHASGQFQPVNESVKTEGLFAESRSADWKIAKAITKPMYYIKTEYEYSQSHYCPKTDLR
ncbi:MAG: hypothetical protein MI862_11245 [Desulfobacterales bacterium]|nr:hypothetical protein [Desulfobacterales bacterium]